MNHLWVLGIMLLAVAALAFLGFFKSREGFQSAFELTTEFLSFSPRIIMPSGKTLGDLLIAGSIKDTSVTPPIFPVITDVVRATSPTDQFIVGTTGNTNIMKMVLIEFSIDTVSKELKVKQVSAKSKSVQTPSETLSAAWNSVTSTFSTNYKVINLRVKIGDAPASHLMPAVMNENTVNPASQLIRCPTGYKFFNSPNGDSMCCRGTVNPYTHTCDAVATDGICAFSEVPDRRLGRTGNYPLCSTLIATEMTSSASQFCPTSLPNYAKESDAAAKCCKNPVQMAGATGFKCSAEDLKDTTQYCIVKGTPVRNPTDGKDEKLCDEAIMVDTTSCPAVGGVTLQKVDYVMGTREATKYANNSLVGRTIPACFGVDKTCIPVSSIEYAKKLGAFTDYDPAKWEYSCEVLGKTARGEIVQSMQRGYLGTSGTYTMPR